MKLLRRSTRMAFRALALAFLMTASAAYADRESLKSDSTSRGAKLLNFDSTGRMEGAYYVEFKSAADLHKLAGARELKTSVLPDLLPVSESAVRRLAEALARSINGTVKHIFMTEQRNAFSLRGVSEEDVRRVLAKDPRIEFIEAVLGTRID